MFIILKVALSKWSSHLKVYIRNYTNNSAWVPENKIEKI